MINLFRIKVNKLPSFNKMYYMNIKQNKINTKIKVNLYKLKV